MSKQPSLKVNIKVIKKAVIVALLVMVVMAGNISVGYGKGKSRTKRNS